MARQTGRGLARGGETDILVTEVLEQLELAVGALGQDGRAEGLHDLLDGHCLAGELVFGRTAAVSAVVRRACMQACNVPDKAKGAHADGLQVGVPAQCQWP